MRTLERAARTQLRIRVAARGALSSGARLRPASTSGVVGPAGATVSSTVVAPGCSDRGCRDSRRCGGDGATSGVHDGTEGRYHEGGVHCGGVDVGGRGGGRERVRVGARGMTTSPPVPPEPRFEPDPSPPDVPPSVPDSVSPRSGPEQVEHASTPGFLCAAACIVDIPPTRTTARQSVNKALYRRDGVIMVPSVRDIHFRVALRATRE